MLEGLGYHLATNKKIRRGADDSELDCTDHFHARTVTRKVINGVLSTPTPV